MLLRGISVSLQSWRLAAWYLTWQGATAKNQKTLEGSSSIVEKGQRWEDCRQFSGLIECQSANPKAIMGSVPIHVDRSGSQLHTIVDRLWSLSAFACMYVPAMCVPADHGAVRHRGVKCDTKAAGEDGKGVSFSCLNVSSCCVHTWAWRRNVLDEYWREWHMDTKAECKRKRIIQEHQKKCCRNRVRILQELSIHGQGRFSKRQGMDDNRVVHQ